MFRTKFLIVLTTLFFCNAELIGQTCADIKAAGLVYCNDDDVVVLNAETSKGSCATVGNTIEWYSSAAIDIPLSTGCNFTTPKLQGNIKYFVRDNTDQSQVITDQVGFDFNSTELTTPILDQYDGNIRTQFIPTKDFILNSFQGQITSWNASTPPFLLIEVRNYTDRTKDSIFTIDISTSATYIDGEILTFDMGYNFTAFDEYDVSFAANGIQVFGYEGTAGTNIDYDDVFGSILEVTSAGTGDGRTNGIDGFGPFFNWEVQAELGAGCPKKEVNVIQRCIEICDDGIDNDSDGLFDEACEAFSCDGKLLQSIGNIGSSGSKLFEMSISPIEFNEINNFPFGINSLAYSAAENRVYSLILDNTSPDDGKIVRIASDGEYQILDNLITKDGVAIDFGFAADIGSDGNYYFLDERRAANGAVTGGTLYVFELVTLTEISRVEVNYTSRIADITFNPTTGNLFGITGASPKNLYEFNPITGNVNTYPDLQYFDETDNQLFNIASGGVVGGIYFLPNGKMIAYGSFLGNNTQNDMIQIDLTTHRNDGNVTVLGQNQLDAFSNDGASCPYALLVEKTASVTEVLPNEEIEYTIDFFNNTGFEIPKIDFSDSLSDYLTLTDITVNDLGDENIIAGSGKDTKTLIINDVNLPVGLSTIKFTVKVNPDNICKDDIIFNQARVDSLSRVLGFSTLSDNPLTPAENDATPVDLISLFDIDPPILDASTPICENDTLVLSSESPYPDFINWYRSNGYSSTNASDTILNSQQSDQGFYYAYIDSAGCVSDTSEVEVTINPLPIASIDPIATFCMGDSVQLNAKSNINLSKFEWILITDSLTALDIFNPLAFSESEITHTVAVESPLGCMDTTEITIEAAQLPDVNVSDDASICLGDQMTLIATGANTYIWSDNIELNTNTGSSVMATPTVNRTYIVIGSTSDGCTDSDTVNLTVTKLDPPAITVSSPLCEKDSLILTATTPKPEYLIWYSTNGYASTNSTDTIFDVNVANAGTYAAYLDSAGCISDTVESEVIINQTPVAFINPIGIFCAGDSVQLFAESDINSSSFRWVLYTDSLRALDVPNPYASSKNEATHTVEVTSPLGCKDSTEITIKAAKLPDIAISDDTSLCIGESAILIADGATSYIWSDDIELNTNSGATVISTPTSTRIYQVIGSTPDGCTDSATVNVIVNDLPILSEIPNAHICEGESITLSTSGTDSTYIWTPSTDLVLVTSNEVSVNPSSDITYQILGINKTGCSTTISVDVTVSTVPDLSLVEDEIQICEGETATFTASGADSLYSWSSATGLNNTNTNEVTSSSTSDITYELTGYNFGGCSSTIKANLIVLNNPIPAVQISDGGNICEGGELDFKITSSDNLGDAPTYNWYSINNGDTTLQGQDPSLSLTNVMQSINILLEATSNLPCVAPANITATSNLVSSIVYLYPDLSISGETDICKGFDAELTVTDNNGVANSYIWTDLSENRTLASTSNTLNINTLNNNKEVQVFASENGCADTTSIELNIIEVSVNITADETLLFAGDEVELFISTNGDSIIGTSDNTSLDFSWPQDQNSQIVTLHDSTVFIVTADKQGCLDTDSILIKVLQGLNAPYFFSPDDDGNNDLWIVKELDTYSNTKINIFNRWGSKIIEIKDNKNTWDGNYRTGNPVPEGVYFYVIEGDVNEELISLTGYVTLVR